MNDTLKASGRIGAELGAAKAEVERLKSLMRQALPCIAMSTNSCAASYVRQFEAALSPQAEPCGGCGNADESKRCIGCGHQFTPAPTDTFAAVDMATAAAQGFRDGQAAVEQAAAQDERELPPPYGWVAVGEFFTDRAKATEAAEKTPCIEVYSRPQMLTRPAQAEQQPWDDSMVRDFLSVALRHVEVKGTLHSQDIRDALRYMAERYAAPIEQTAPQGKFRMGDLVKKSTGSEWVGRVVGWYSTNQTPEGYAVESSAHRNSVQIYPVTALEAVDERLY